MESSLMPGADFAGLRIERLIGAGGMGEVYLAFDPTLERRVAVKVVAPALAEDQRYRERFLREARLAASLEHPAIIPIYGAGESGGQLYLAMRFVDGGSLAERIADGGRIEPSEAFRMLAPVANALDVAHAAGLVHRDVKPGNVLLQGDVALLADFGLARSTASAADLTRDDGVVVSGTMGYIAPEQLEGDSVSGAADQYALACVLFECVGGHKPYERPNDLAVVYAHLSEPPPKVTVISPDLPSELDAVIGRGMAKDPSERFGSCSALLTAFAEACGLGLGANGAATAADTQLDRPRRSRHRLVIAGVTVVAAAVVVAVIVATRHENGHPASVTAPVPPAPKHDEVAALDPATLEVRARVAVGATPSSATTGGGAVWVLNTDDQTITRVNPKTNRVERTFPIGATPFDLAFGAGALWVTTGAPSTTPYTGGVAATVTRVDPATNSPVFTINLPRAKAPAPAPSGRGQITFGLGYVWVADPDGSVARIDPATNGVKAIPDVGAFAIASGDGAVWALTGDGLRRIDATTKTASPPIPLQTADATSVAVGGGAVWVADPEQGLVVRVDPGPPVQAQTITTSPGASVVSFGAGRVWVANALGGTVTAIDPVANRAVRTATVGGAPQTAAGGEGGVWVPSLGNARPTPATGATPVAGDIQSPRCGRVFRASAGGRPQFLITSDFPLTGGAAFGGLPMASAVRFVVQEHRFRAGRFSIGYQSCDGSGADPVAMKAVCRANAAAYAATPRVLGIVGTRSSGCASQEIPILNAAPNGPLAMISPANTDPSLTTDPSMAPSGTRSYTRVVATDDRQSAADATLARQLGVRRPFILHETGSSGGDDYLNLAVAAFDAAAPTNGLHIAGSATWVPGRHTYDATVAQVERSHADGVFFVGYPDPGVGKLMTSLRGRLGSNVPVIAPDSFVPISDVLAAIGPAARGIYVSSTGPTNDRLSPYGRLWARRFATTRQGGAVEQWSPLTAEATEVLLAAIANSDGTRASVTRALLKSSPPAGIFGPFTFTPTGDIDPAFITILRIVGGNQPGPNFSTDFAGGVFFRNIAVPA